MHLGPRPAAEAPQPCNLVQQLLMWLSVWPAVNAGGTWKQQSLQLVHLGPEVGITAACPAEAKI